MYVGSARLNAFNNDLTVKYRKVITAQKQVPRYEDEWGFGGKAPEILKLGTIWKCVVSLLHAPDRFIPGTHRIGGWMDPRSDVDTVAKKKSTPDENQNPLVRSARSIT